MAVGFVTARTRVCVVLAGVMLALMVPSAALAKNTASFSSVSPKASSSSLLTTPTITVGVYDRYGVKGSTNYSMTLDGKIVKPSITYSKRGDYRRFKLTYRVIAGLSVGSHKVVVKVRDRKKKSSTYTWTFTVLAPLPPPPSDPGDTPTEEMPVTIADAACGSCHLGYPLAHPTSTCSGCHGETAPLGDPAYSPAQESAHTLGCMLEACHVRGGGAFPHVISSDCASCHTAANPAIPRLHGAADETDHLSTSTFCAKSGCHLASLTAEHYRHEAGGAKLSCATCHGSTDAVVRAAMASGSTACTSCHDLSVEGHPGVEAAHAGSAPQCAGAYCHAGGNIVAVHEAPGCVACHSGGETATAVCATAGCHGAADAHPESDPHPGMAAAHSTGLPVSCAKVGCHVADLARLHAVNGGCGVCHDAGKVPTRSCVTVGCHASAGPSHTQHPAPVAGQVIFIGGLPYGNHACTECHTSLDLISLHRSTCETCHPGPRTGATFSGGCVQGTCHQIGSAVAMHGSIDSAHSTGATPSCVGASCHAGGSSAAAIHGGASGCPTCHVPGTTPTLVCATAGCHGSLDARPLADPHPGRRSAHTTGLATSCVKSGCHASDLEALHAAKLGCATCHADGKTPAKVCATAGCHPTKSPLHDAHATAPAAQVISIGGVAYGSHVCVECHTSTDLLPVHASRCSSCHTGSAVTARLTSGCAQAGCHSASTRPVHGEIESAHASASVAGCATTDCHTGSNVAAIHSAQGCTTCHVAGKAATAACATVGCHGAGDSHPAAAPHPGRRAAHTTGLATSCIKTGCHASDLEALHAAKLGCATCHADGKTPAKACATAGCHSAITSEATHPNYTASHRLGTTPSCFGTNCHAAGADANAIHPNTGCATCHAEGKPALTLACATTGCHGAPDAHPAANPHPGMVRSHTYGLSTSCAKAGCHPSDLVALHADAKGCATCHVKGSTPTRDCTASGCHQSNGSPMHDAHPSTVTSAAFKINGLNYGTYSCSLCHATTELIAVHGGRTSCTKCHPDAADGARPWNGGCDQNGCHSATSARPMHADLNASHVTDTQPNCTRSGCHQGNSNVGGRDTVLVHFAGQKCDTCHGQGKTPTKDCSRCHEQTRTGDHQFEHTSCNECHDYFEWDPVTATANKGARITPVHWSLFDAKWTVQIGRATIRPGYPYGDYTTLVYPGKLGTPGPYISDPYLGFTGTYDCDDCHTGAGKTWVHPASNYFTCGSGGDCHEHHGNWDPAQLSESYVHNTPPASWRVIMQH